MQELTALDWFAGGALVMFLLASTIVAIKIYVDDEIRKLERRREKEHTELRSEMRRKVNGIEREVNKIQRK